MRSLITYVFLATMVAYAIGLPQRLHDSEHARAADACCAPHLLPFAHLTHSPSPLKPHAPAQSCAICIQLQALIAAPDAPITLLDAGTHLGEIFLLQTSHHGRPAPTIAPCRGPPSA